jgi:hypothetical protein
LAAALSLITEGRSVDFGDFSLALLDGALRVDVSYDSLVKDEAEARGAIQNVQSQLNELLDSAPDFARTLAALPKRFALVHSYGQGEVEVGCLSEDALIWL